MKISDVLEELGAIQGKYGDIDVYCTDWRAKDEHMQQDDLVVSVTVETIRIQDSKEIKPCVLIANY